MISTRILFWIFLIQTCVKINGNINNFQKGNLLVDNIEEKMQTYNLTYHIKETLNNDNRFIFSNSMTDFIYNSNGTISRECKIQLIQVQKDLVEPNLMAWRCKFNTNLVLVCYLFFGNRRAYQM